MASRFDYGPLRAKVIELLDKYGTLNCQLKRPGAGTPDPTKPWKPVSATPDILLDNKVTIVPDNVSFRRGKWNAPQALTEGGRGKAYASAAITDLEPGDWLEVPKNAALTEWEIFVITRAEQVAPGGDTVLWELTLRS